LVITLTRRTPWSRAIFTQRGSAGLVVGSPEVKHTSSVSWCSPARIQRTVVGGLRVGDVAAVAVLLHAEDAVVVAHRAGEDVHALGLAGDAGLDAIGRRERRGRRGRGRRRDRRDDRRGGGRGVGHGPMIQASVRLGGWIARARSAPRSSRSIRATS
jgi:hypothetical protein